MTTLEAELATVCELLASEDATDASKLLREHPARVVEFGYDNWNGRTTRWEIRIEVGARLSDSARSEKLWNSKSPTS